MHPPHVRASILALVDQGLNDCAISRRTGIPRTTVRDLRQYRDEPRRHNNGDAELTETCPRCWRSARPMRFVPEDYAELLGLYLGDGSISRHPRTHRLRIVLDAKYPGIIEDAHALLKGCFPGNDIHVGAGSKGNCRSLSVYSTHLLCLFPQHPAAHRPRALAAGDHRPGALGIPTGLHQVGWERLRQQDGPLRVPELRLREPLQGHRAPLHGRVRATRAQAPRERGFSRPMARSCQPA